MNRRTKRSDISDRPQRGRAEVGTSFAELAAAIVIIVLMLLFAMDLGVIMMAFGLTDRAARDAARAAAMGSTKPDAIARANAILFNYARTNSNWLATSPALVGNDLDYHVGPSTPSSADPPRVTVVTTSTIKVPAPAFMGATVGDNGNVVVKKEYTFPIVKLGN